MILPWPKIRSSHVGDYRIFKIRQDLKRSPKTDAAHDFFVIDCANWVNVIALTANDQLVMVEQYRHGSDTVEWEVPGGMIDPEDESPLAAGMRELREETGYEGDTPTVLGEVFPNPAIMSNTCFTVLIRNCMLKHATMFDHGEDLITKLVPADEAVEMAATGRIRHSMVIVALHLFDAWRKKTANR